MARMHKVKLTATREEFANVTEEANGLCMICKKELKLCYDHNHKTGKLRGKLCRNCNCGLGAFGDNADNLSAAISYLQSRGSYG